MTWSGDVLEEVCDDIAGITVKEQRFGVRYHQMEKAEFYQGTFLRNMRRKNVKFFMFSLSLSPLIFLYYTHTHTY